MNFDQTPEFQKDLKGLSKKWRSLPQDIEDAQLLITDVYADSEQRELVQQKFFDGKRATRLVPGVVEVVKMRLDVAALGTNSKVRVVFVAIIAESSVVFVELYAKNEKDREDPKRYRDFIS
jgi:hypothetical protein